MVRYLKQSIIELKFAGLWQIAITQNFQKIAKVPFYIACLEMGTFKNLQFEYGQQ